MICFLHVSSLQASPTKETKELEGYIHSLSTVKDMMTKPANFFFLLQSAVKGRNSASGFLFSREERKIWTVSKVQIIIKNNKMCNQKHCDWKKNQSNSKCGPSVFRKQPPIVSYRTEKSLKDILVRAKLPLIKLQSQKQRSTFKRFLFKLEGNLHIIFC